MGIGVDATRESELREALDQIVEKWGRVDILLNAPGINSGTPIFEITREEWDKILAVNLTSYFLASQVFGKLMVEQGEGGSIINVSSAASLGEPTNIGSVYQLSKVTLNHFTRQLAVEVEGTGVTANATVTVGDAGDADASTYTVTVDTIAGDGTLKTVPVALNPPQFFQVILLSP